MATVANLVFALTANVQPFLDGFNKAEKHFQSFQKNFVTKFAGGAAILRELDQGLKVVADELERAHKAGEAFSMLNFGQGIADILTSVPVAGELGRIIAEFAPDTRAFQDMERHIAASVEKSKELAAIQKSMSSAQHLLDVANLHRDIAQATDPLAKLAAELELRTAEINARFDTLLNSALNAAGLDRATANRIRDTLNAARALEIEAAAMDSAAERASILNRQLDEQAEVQRRLEEAAQRAHDVMASAGKRVWEQTRTPMEQYMARVAELDELLKGLFITQETYARAVAMAREQLESFSVARDRAMQPGGPDLFERRFTQGFQSGNANRFLKPGDTGIDEVADNTEKQLAEDRKQSRMHADTNRLLTKIAENQPVVVEF